MNSCNPFHLMAVVLAASCGVAHAQDEVLYQQKEIIHFKVAKPDEKPVPVIEKSEPKQKLATALRISGYVRAEGVTGVRDAGFSVVTNVEYETTPIFWYTVLYPETGTHPWQYVEKYVEARLPVQKLEVKFVFTHPGEAWFRDFRIEAVPAWKENAEMVVATLGDSTDVLAYMPDENTQWHRLQSLLRDRFPDRHLRVRCLGESGEWLAKLLESGRLERELGTIERCDFMIIRYGLNDNGKRIPPADFARQLVATAERVVKKFPECCIVLATTIPPSAPAYSAATREVAKEHGWPLIDLEAFLLSEAKRGNGNWHRGKGSEVGYRTEANPPGNADGLRGDKHPNAYGAQLIAEEEFRALEPLVAQRLGVVPPAKPSLP